MKIKVSKTTKTQLNWLVSKCEDFNAEALVQLAKKVPGKDYGCFLTKYCTDWSQGGPILDKENIGLICQQPESTKRCAYHQTSEGEVFYHYGDTLLIAAMRCYVVSKLGDEVEVPDELS